MVTLMPKPKPSAAKPKNKGGRPRKVAVLATGKEAATRFAAGLRFAIAGGQQPK